MIPPILEILFHIVAVIGCIALIIGIIALVYYICKVVYLDIKGAEEYKEYFRNLYKSKYEEDIDKAKKDYDYSLKCRSEEYFRKFYEEDKKKRLEENQNGN